MQEESILILGIFGFNRMRAYGRRGPVFRSSLKSNRGSSSSSNVEFSDDDVNSIVPDLSSTMSSSITDHPVEAFLDKHDTGEHASTSFVSINKVPSHRTQKRVYRMSKLSLVMMLLWCL